MERSLELRQSESPDKVQAFCIADDIPPTLDLLSCNRFLIPRIRKCNSSHTSCHSTSSQMPSRLIYVGSESDATSPRLQLSPSLKPYIALSHCWGDQSAILTTTTANIKDFLREIAWIKLPKSFQDAIAITRSLKIDYLWIDSLCIIQDDPSDWKTESVKMAEIYSGAYLTIAASGASSAESGCFFTRSHETDSGIKISHAVSQLQSDLVSTTYGVKTRYIPSAHRQLFSSEPTMNGAPLWTRAWGFQERLLSNRVISTLR